MTAIHVGSNMTPEYILESADIDAETGRATNCIRIGATCFLTDTATWKIVDDDLVLQPYNVPAAMTVENVTIDAAIAIDQTTTGTTNAVHVLPAGGVGSLTETAPATDTASSGLNGRLQRIAQRLTSLIALIPASLGQKNKAGSLAVTLASDEDALAVTGPLTDTQLRATAVPVSGTFYQATQPVSGTVTANAGTNLNTSALALETGGNLAEIKTNTDNIPAVGQAAMAASMPVTMASDQSDLVVVPHNLADEIIVTPTLTIAATYVSGDYVGTSTTPMTFSNCARVNGGTGTIAGVALVDSNVASVAGELWLFDAPITTPNDSAAWAISGADALKCIGVIPFSTYYSGGNASVTFAEKQGIVFKTESDSRSLYGAFVTRGAPTYATGSLTFKLRVWQD
jgi:hypothetical protein